MLLRNIASLASSLFLMAAILVVLVPTSVDAATPAPYPIPVFSIKPNVLDISKGNVSIQVLRVPTGSAVFLLRALFPLSSTYSCSAPPSPSQTDRRTAVTYPHFRNYTFNIRTLVPDLYYVCYANNTRSIANNWWNSIGTITLIQSVKCSGTRSMYRNYGVCEVTPGVIGSTGSNTTIVLQGAKRNTQAFLLIYKWMDRILYNCSNPPPLTSGLRTKTGRVLSDGTVRLPLVGTLQSGIYRICFLNSTAKVPPTWMTYKPLKQMITVGGDIDIPRSRVCCAGPYMAGVRGYCTINTFDVVGYATGSAEDSCKLRMCSMTDGAGQPVTDVIGPYFVRPGVFEVSFIPQGSGCQGSASVSYQGYTLGNAQSFFTVAPNTPLYSNANATCVVTNTLTGATSCSVTLKDRFNNPSRRCGMSTLPNSVITCSTIFSD